MKKERPILFNTEMVQAVLDGRKTQTRRVIKEQPDGEVTAKWLDLKDKMPAFIFCNNGMECVTRKCPYGEVGNRLWVRETWADGYEDKPYIYKADGWDADHKFKPSIHMPRAASRTLLEITDVRVERVQDISEIDALAEGCVSTAIETDNDYLGLYAKEHFANLWNIINIQRGFGWDVNPWVWVVEFKIVE